MREDRSLKGLAILAALTGLALLVAGCPSAPEKAVASRRWAVGRVLRVACFGGEIATQSRLLVGSIVEAVTGCKVEYVTGTSRGHYQKLVEARGGPVPYDVVYLDGMVLDEALAQDLLAPLDPKEHPELAELDGNARPQPKFGPGVQFYTVGLCYDKDAMVEARVPSLARWSDLWKYESLRGHVAVPNISHTSGLDFLLVATKQAGGDPTTLEGLKRGIEKIKELKPRLIYRNLAALQKAFEDRSVWVAPLYNSRSYTFIDGGLNLAFLLPEDGGFGHITTLNLVKDSPNLDLAKAYLNVALSPAVQVAQAVHAPFGPSHQRVFPILGAHPELCERFPLGSDELSSLTIPDWKSINALRDELDTAWKAAFPE